MTLYRFEAADSSGNTVRGTEEASSEAALNRVLAVRGLYPLRVSLVETQHNGGRSGWVARRADVAEAMATLAALLEAGLSLERALVVVSTGAARRDVAAAMDAVRFAVQRGGRITDAVAANPAFFPPLAVGLLGAGERGGQLAEAVRRLADAMEREGALRARVIAAVTYPAILAAVGAGATGLLLGFVLPKFVDLLAAAGARIPLSTRVLLTLSQGVVSYGWIVAPAVVVAALLLWRSQNTAAGRVRVDSFMLRTPLLGELRARYASAQVARTLGTLLTGGVPLLAALEAAAEAVPDAAIAADLRAAGVVVRRGDTLSGAMARGRGFPHTFTRLVEVGEQTGELDTMMLRAAALIEADLERRLTRSIALLEPLLILIFGMLVGGVALSLLQAIYGIHADAF